LIIIGIKYANLALAFLLELCVLAALCYWGFKTGSGLLIKIILGIGVPLLAVFFWGMFGAPNSSMQLHGWLRFVLEVVFFGSAALAVWAAGRPSLAVIFGVIVIVNHILKYVLGQ
jgi:hypothetical protein